MSVSSVFFTTTTIHQTLRWDCFCTLHKFGVHQVKHAPPRATSSFYRHLHAPHKSLPSDKINLSIIDQWFYEEKYSKNRWMRLHAPSPAWFSRHVLPQTVTLHHLPTVPSSPNRVKGLHIVYHIQKKSNSYTTKMYKPTDSVITQLNPGLSFEIVSNPF